MSKSASRWCRRAAQVVGIGPKWAPIQRDAESGRPPISLVHGMPPGGHHLIYALTSKSDDVARQYVSDFLNLWRYIRQYEMIPVDAWVPVPGPAPGCDSR